MDGVRPLQAQPVPQAGAAPPRGILPLSVTGLVFATGSRKLVDIARLTVRPGGTTVVMGPNGAGKSLLLRLLHGLIAPSAGEIRWNGAAPTAATRRRQGMVFQRPVLLRRSAEANIAYALKAQGLPRGARAARTAAMLDQGGLAHLAAQPARTLSGGEQQRLAVLRALAVAPEVLFMDEPTSSLDPVSTGAIEALVGDAAKVGTKVIMVTHDPGQALRLADDVVFLHHGRVTEHTPAAGFFDRPDSEPARALLAGRLLS